MGQAVLNGWYKSLDIVKLNFICLYKLFLSATIENWKMIWKNLQVTE